MNELHSKVVMFQMYYPEIAAFLVFALKSTGIVALGALAGIALRRRSAAARGWVWRATLAGCVALPLFHYGPGALKDLRPGWTKPLTPESAGAFIEQAETLHLVDASTDVMARREQARDEARTALGVRPPWEEATHQTYAVTVEDFRATPWRQIEAWIKPVWWTVAGLFALLAVTRMAVGCGRLRKKARAGGGELQQAANEIAVLMKLKREPRVRLVVDLQSPLMLGWLRPTVFFPEAAEAWSAQRCEATLLHELTHWKRGDHWWQQAGRLLACAFWWQPLVAWAVRQMNAEAEEAADDAVVLHQSSPEAYATMLVELAAGAVGGPPSVGVPMIGFRSLEKRIRSLLRENPWRGRMGNLGLVVVFVLGLISVATASFYVGLAASERGTSAADTKEVVTLSSEERAVLERLVDNTLKRLAALRFLHFQLEERTLREEGEAVWRSPQPTKMEAWVDQWTGIHRAEYRPWVLVLSDRPGQFAIEENTQINDGETSVSYESEGDLDRAQRRKPEGLEFHLGLRESTDLLHLARLMLQRDNLIQDESRHSLERVQWRGREVWQLREEMIREGKVFQQRTLFFDPNASDMVVFEELLFPIERPDAPSRWEVQDIGRTPGGFVYPAAYRRNSTWGPAKTTSEIRVTKLDVLDALPAGITQLPQSPAEKYLARDGKPKRHPHLVVNYVHAEKENTALVPKRVNVRINSNTTIELRADSAGRFVVPLPDEEITFLEVSAAQPGFAAQVVRWRKTGEALQLPERYTVKLWPGTPVSGKVVNEEGNPIAGAEVRLMVIGRRAQGSDVFRDGFNLWNVRAVTNSDGVWKADDFPADLAGLSVRISAPGYQASTDSGTAEFRTFIGLPYTALRDGSWVHTLRRGEGLSGTVVSATGAPVANARLVIGRDIHGSNPPTTTSDATGAFRFKGLPSGPTTLTVEAPTHKPWTRDLVLPLAEPLKVSLERGNVLRARVVDEKGNPCAGLNVNVDTWRTLRTLQFSTQTDADGHFTWNGAADEPVSFAFGACQSREFLSGLLLTAKSEEQVVVMKPALRLSARVIDAITRKPLHAFRVTLGFAWKDQLVSWDSSTKKTFLDGTLMWETDRIGAPLAFMIQADGYKTLQTPAFPTEQTSVTETFELHPE